MADFTEAQILQYYQIRLDPYKIRHSKGSWYRSICGIHKGSNNSQLAVNTAEGNFRCFSCDAKGGSIYAFEQQMLKSELGYVPSHDDVQRALESILQVPFTARIYPQDLHQAHKPAKWDVTKARDKFVYLDEDGFELYTVYKFVDRHGNKLTPACRPCPCGGNHDAECPNPRSCDGGRIWNLEGVRRVLYRLSDVMQSMVLFVVEGEKNANDLSREMARYIAKRGGFQLPDGTFLDRVGVTTNSHGANSWKKEYGFAPFFYGKTVIKLGDNDAAGRVHDQAACADISQFAKHLYTLSLPVGDGEDISDYLKDHSIEDFAKLLVNRQEWKVRERKHAQFSSKPDEPRVLLIKPSKLLGHGASEDREWLVEGLIARGTRGLVAAAPKTGKSLLFLDLALALGSNQSFLGAKPYGRPIRCAIISREDPPAEVYYRLRALAAGRGLTWGDVDLNLRVNTVEQSQHFNIDNQNELGEMAEWLRADSIEFCVLDVMNKIHSADEVSSKDMARIMPKFDELESLSGSQVCIIQHLNANGNVKGNTTIPGWADYILKLETDRDDDSIKHMSMQTKASASKRSRTLHYWQSDDQRESRISLVSLATE